MPLALATAGLGPALNASPAPAARLRQDGAQDGAAAGARRRFEAEEEIYAEGDRVVHFYKVVSGAVRTYRLLSDGRRQIDGFHLPGDIFGLEAGAERRTGADALVDTTLVAHRRSDRAALTGEAGALAHEVAAAMLRALERAQDHMLLLGRKSAKERVASFLLGLARRSGTEGTIALPMSRADIADHLGLTIESVSRSFTQLEREGVIALANHRRAVEVQDRAALRRLDA
ncbi:helix-turn-helix domain-containing protein [Methylobacterium currus]|uniref:helix-turn-helix domain-containing protein n=1 Tax=Methylobacterium currus TaxID=2051553 RepID=UPI001E5C96AA|nr:helix-turn-helix domain-containing protein [Methylobacterium currus]UHC17588.1 helix-turn-helix domain-containing protein [Methylobacterium currus]